MKRRNQSSSWFVSADEKKRFVSFVALLIQIDRRLRVEAAARKKANMKQPAVKETRKSATIKRRKQSKQHEAQDITCLYDMVFGPCFFGLKKAFQHCLLHVTYEGQVDVADPLLYLKAT